MLRVLHYIPGFLYGGIESMFLSWYKNIDASKTEFELLIRTQDDEAQTLKEYKNLGGVYYRLSPITDFFSYAKSVNLFFREHNDYDIFHIHEADPLIMMMAKRYGMKRIVLHSHSTNIANSIKEKIRFLDEKIEKTLFADRGFACSSPAALWKFGSCSFKHTPVVFIHNAIPVHEYRYNEAKRNELRRTYGLENKFVVGHVGRMTYPKNQFFLLDIFRELVSQKNNTVLIMLGDGPDENELKRYAQKNGIRDKVMFLGLRNDVKELLQVMDCFLLPSRYEGLPVTLIEAQASGLPCFISDVVASEADIVPEIVFRKNISDTPVSWAETILSCHNGFCRQDTSQIISEHGYDVVSEVKKLEREYERVKEEIK